MAASLSMISPAGRIVAGSVFKPSLKDMKGKDRVKPQYFFALAIPKSNPAMTEFLNQLWVFTIENVFNNPRANAVLRAAIQEWIKPKSGFAWKIDDGDHPKHADKEGYPGNWVIKYSTTIAPKCYDRETRQIDPTTVKTGYYVDVATSVAHNGYFDDQSGLYVNANMVRLLGYGDEIQPGPSAAQVFGGVAAQVIGSQIPVAPAGGIPGAGAPAPTVPNNPLFGPAAAAPAYATAAPLVQSAAAAPNQPPAMPTPPVANAPFMPPSLPDVASVQGAQDESASLTPAPSPTNPSGDNASVGTVSPIEGFAAGTAQ